MIYDHAHVAEEVRYARRTLAARVQGVQDIVDAMVSGLAPPRAAVDAPTRNIENHYHQLIAYLAPRIAGGEARVEVETGRAGPGRVEAAAGEAAVNQWIMDTRHRELCRRLATDYLLGWGVAGLRLDRLPGQETDDYHTTPVAFRVERGDAYWDPKANEWETRQYAGFQWTIAHDDLVEKAEREDGWDLGEVRDLPTDVRDDHEHERGQRDDGPKRGEVTVRELWVPRVLSDNAPRWATGTILTLGVGSKRYLREPRPFFGPPWGPIYLYDAYYVPGQPLGASPAEMVREQVEELNRHADALSRSAARRRKVLVGDLFKDADARAVYSARDGDMVLMSGFDRAKFQEIEFDGPTDTQATIVAMLRDRLARESGIDDAQRGAVTGVGTATENALAAEAIGIRVAALADRFASCDEMLLSGVLWYVMHSRSLRVRLRPEAAGIPVEAAQGIEMVVRGGMRPGLGWPDFRLRVDRRSVARESDAARSARMGRAVATALGIAQVAPSIAPFADVRALMDMAGDAEGVPDLGRLVDPDAAAALFGAEAGPSTREPAEAEVAPAPAQPRPKVVPGGRRREEAAAR